MVDGLGRSIREHFGVMEMISVLFVVVVTWAYKSAKTHRNVHLNWVPCNVYKLYHNNIDLEKTKSSGPEWQEITTSESRQSSGIISSKARLKQLHLDKADGNTHSYWEQSDNAQIVYHGSPLLL